MDKTSFKQFAKGYLANNGFWPDQADKIMTLIEQAPENSAMLGCWGDLVDGYPASMKAVVVMTAKSHALKWIEENMPEHFAKHMLNGGL